MFVMIPLLQSINSIYFNVTLSNASKVIKCNSLVNNRLHIRNLSVKEMLEGKRHRLLAIMKREH